MQIIQTTGFSCAANVFDDDVPDEAPAEDAEAFPIDEVIDWNRRINNENVLINWKYYQSSHWICCLLLTSYHIRQFHHPSCTYLELKSSSMISHWSFHYFNFFLQKYRSSNCIFKGESIRLSQLLVRVFGSILNMHINATCIYNFFYYFYSYNITLFNKLNSFYCCIRVHLRSLFSQRNRGCLVSVSNEWTGFHMDILWHRPIVCTLS